MEPWVTAVVVILCIIALIVIFKLYLKFSTSWDRSPTCLIGKTTVVTGSNTGLGYYTALDFAKRGARVILACRDPVRAEEARAKIVEATGNPNVVVKLVDLASLSSVREFAKEINATEDRLDVLVNNAGASGFGHVITADGMSKTMQINHFGPFLLTILLIGILKKSAPSRIVTVSSDLVHAGKVNLNDLNAWPRGIFTGIFDYANTKLCNLLCTNELARKLKGSGVVANTIFPGAVQTDFFRNLSSIRRTLGNAIAKMFYKTTEEGAQTSIYAAVSRDIDGVTGAVFSECRMRSMPRVGRNEELAKKLWEKCEEFVKLTSEERQLLSVSV